MTGKKYFNPNLITDPRLHTDGLGSTNMPPPAPVEVPVPVPVVVKPKRSMSVSIEAAKRAQGIYPKEAQEKQVMMDNAKTPPAPTGAWGAPQMIVLKPPLLPSIPDNPKVQEEVRKSILDLVKQMNTALQEIDTRLKALEP